MEVTKDWIFIELTKEQAEQMNAVWVESRFMWKIPNTLGALRELYKAGYHQFLDYGKAKNETRKKLMVIKESNNHPIFDERLRPYQNQDINFLRCLPHAAIFNEQRTGKTPTTLKLIEAIGTDKVIVVCPASLVLNWQSEVKKWTEFSAIPIKGTKKKRLALYQSWKDSKDKVFMLMSYETLREDIDHITKEITQRLDFSIVVDEAHRLANYKSNRSKALYILGAKATHRYALTGTPAMNKPSDIYGILRFLYPSKYPSFWQFAERYFKVWNTPWGSKDVSKKYKRENELIEALELISVQRKRAEVMQWLPPKEYKEFNVEMTKKQRKAYEDMLYTFTVEQDGEIKADAPSLLAQITRLRQICLNPEILDIEADSAKENFLMDWLDDNPNEQVVIFSNYSSYLKLLHAKLTKKTKKIIGLITGDTSQKDRQSYVEYFQKGTCPIILANIEAGGVGLTLDRASTVIFLDRHYVPALNEQAEDRIVPTTEQSNRNCLVMDIVCKDSIDQDIQKILKGKESVIETINNYRGIKDFLEAKE